MDKKTQHISLIVGGVLVAAALIVATYMIVKQQPKTDDQPPASQGDVVMTGNLVCLPKKGDGPQTMECAYGLQSAGKYYALDMSGMDTNLSSYTFEDQLEVSGELIDPEADTTYAIEGTIKVKSMDLVSGAS